MRMVKVGVIGCGEIAQWMHLPFLTELPGFRVTAVCDISPRVVEHVGERFGVERRFTDVQALLEHGDVEAAVIATPIHSDPAIAAAHAGKHVLVEKPMAFNLAEAEAMVDAAEQAGVTLMVAYMKRYDPGYRYGRRLMQQMQDVRLIRVHDLCGPNGVCARSDDHVPRPRDGCTGRPGARGGDTAPLGVGHRRGTPRERVPRL